MSRQIPDHLARKSRDALQIAHDAMAELQAECEGASIMVRVGLSSDLARLDDLLQRADHRLLQDDDGGLWPTPLMGDDR